MCVRKTVGLSVGKVAGVAIVLKTCTNARTHKRTFTLSTRMRACNPTCIHTLIFDCAHACICVCVCAIRMMTRQMRRSSCLSRRAPAAPRTGRNRVAGLQQASTPPHRTCPRCLMTWLTPLRTLTRAHPQEVRARLLLCCLRACMCVYVCMHVCVANNVNAIKNSDPSASS